MDARTDLLVPRWRLMVLPGAYGPMRPEELSELRRRGVDLDELTIRLRMAAPELMSGKQAEGPTKSEAGTRVVVLPGSLRE
nr:hypothetical protein [Streptomyces sp. NBC_00690]